MTQDVVWQKDGSWRVRVEDGRGWVEHPGSVVLVPVLDGHILLLAQYRATLGETIVELPAGTRGWDEPWAACAQRELREETGYRAESLVSLGAVWPAPGLTDELMQIYLATGLTPDPLPQDADETIAVRPIPIPDALALLDGDQLRDAKTIVALLRAMPHLRP